MSGEENTDIDVCAICTDNNDSHSYTLQCNHTFHTPCIIEWFRHNDAPSTCPLCRCSESPMGFRDVKARACYLRQKARGKNVPKDLIRLVDKIRKAEKNFKSITSERAKFKKDNKKILLTSRKFNSKYWKAVRKVRNLKRMLGFYNHPDVPIPLISHRVRRVLRRLRRENGIQF